MVAKSDPMGAAMTDEPGWLGRAVFGTFRGLEAVGDGVLLPARKHTEFLEFRGSKDDSFDIPQPGEIAAFRRLLRSNGNYDFEVVGCIRRSKDSTGRPGFFGCCVAVNLGDASLYPSALDYCYDYMSNFEERSPEAVEALSDIGTFDLNGASEAKTLVLKAIKSDNACFDFETLSRSDGISVDTIGFILNCITLLDKFCYCNIFLSPTSRKSSTSITFNVLNQILSEKRNEINEIRRSIENEAQQYLDDEYAKFQREKRELLEQNERLEARLRAPQSPPQPLHERRPVYAEETYYRTDARRDVNRHRGLGSGLDDYGDEFEESFCWREVLKISGIVISVVVSICALIIIGYSIVDILFL